MKKRIKIDSSILSFVIVLTGFLYVFPGLYSQSKGVDNALDILGILCIIKGVLIRMAARGHKKKFSKKGGDLVTSGLYSLVRNPMYLGSCSLGIGFVLLVWPWWSVPIFLWLFYIRFNKQVVKEEELLGELFGQKYKNYCKGTPRVFPSIKKCLEVKTKEIIDVKELFSTKEIRGLLTWPLLAVVLEYFQEKVVFKSADLNQIVGTFLGAIVVYLIVVVAYYHLRK
ncbi:MAG: isoprenylcysteine carboxylmethyltransferase family protein [Candidatus Omnitrophica bacterium]|nr:isoprenylcysteine carboxylmethyltransferase family protein [Candidatus Omnitrophota bacterium]MBU4334235.1 isoprenylcysteine carboxylmethyltransferase family protein [Candidatus Omnitrophota bacterium]